MLYQSYLPQKTTKHRIHLYNNAHQRTVTKGCQQQACETSNLQKQQIWVAVG